jgi:hypothetical protein
VALMGKWRHSGFSVCPACRGEMRVIAVIEEQSDHILTSMKTVVKTLPD